MENKDSKVQEQTELVIEGTILADHFKDRKTGKDIGDDSSEINALKQRVEVLETYITQLQTLLTLSEGKVKVNGKIELEGISKIVDNDDRTIIPDSVAGKYIVGGSDFVYHTTDLPTD